MFLVSCSVVHDGDRIKFGSLMFLALYTPGHTVEHVVYLLDGLPFHMPPSLFTGDILFLAGIGEFHTILDQGSNLPLARGEYK